MKLSTRSRYGTRMMMDLAQHSDEAPIQMSDIAKRQNISVKYLEQLIIPLKKAKFIKSVRGPKGGHMLTMPPERIKIGEIVKVLEGDSNLTRCIENPSLCDKAKGCPTRDIWRKATRAMYNELDSVTLSEMLTRHK